MPAAVEDHARRALAAASLTIAASAVDWVDHSVAINEGGQEREQGAEAGHQRSRPW